MGTSQSARGPSNASPTTSDWSGATSSRPLAAGRFTSFRRAVSSFVQSGQRSDLERAIGHYARSASGGGGIGPARHSPYLHAGAALVAALAGAPAAPNAALPSIDFLSLSNRPIVEVIGLLAAAFSAGAGGDADRVRVAMIESLAECLDGAETFDPAELSSDLLMNLLVVYLARTIFLQVLNDAGSAWLNANSVAQQVHAEESLRELIDVVVEQEFSRTIVNLPLVNFQTVLQIQEQTVRRVWAIWEGQ